MDEEGRLYLKNIEDEFRDVDLEERIEIVQGRIISDYIDGIRSENPEKPLRVIMETGLYYGVSEGDFMCADLLNEVFYSN